eukprot:345211-Chlamydomonas_euryale.AAC.2
MQILRGHARLPRPQRHARVQPATWHRNAAAAAAPAIAAVLRVRALRDGRRRHGGHRHGHAPAVAVRAHNRAGLDGAANGPRRRQHACAPTQGGVERLRVQDMRQGGKVKHQQCRPQQQICGGASLCSAGGGERVGCISGDALATRSSHWLTLSAAAASARRRAWRMVRAMPCSTNRQRAYPTPGVPSPPPPNPLQHVWHMHHAPGQGCRRCVRAPCMRPMHVRLKCAPHARAPCTRPMHAPHACTSCDAGKLPTRTVARVLQLVLA